MLVLLYLKKFKGYLQLEIRKIQSQNTNIHARTHNLYRQNINYISTSPLKTIEQDSFVRQYQQNCQPTFQGKPVIDGWITKFLKNRSYETSIKGSKRPYLSIKEDLINIIKPVEIKVGKDEKITAFDINPNNSEKYLIFLHGFSQNITSNQPLYKALSESNFGVLAIDYRAYGKNSPSTHTSETDIMHDIQAAAKYLKEKGINSIGLVGHSFGGYMAAKTSNINNFDFQILVSPMLSLEFWLNNVLKNPGKYRMESLMIRLIPGFKEHYLKTFDIGKHITSNTTPTYIVHSKTDGYINVKRVNEFAKTIYNLKEYILLKRGGHRMDDFKIEGITEILNKL